MTRQLTEEEIKAVSDVIDGADVWGYADAGLYRKIEREVPGMVRTVKARGAPKDGAERQPYFGVRATAAGRRLAQAS